MRHAHQLFHSLQSLPSSQHPQRLPSLSYPSIFLLLVKLVKHFCWMLPSYLQWSCHTYLALGGDKGTKLRIRLTRNGIRLRLSCQMPSGSTASPSSLRAYAFYMAQPLSGTSTAPLVSPPSGKPPHIGPGYTRLLLAWPTPHPTYYTP
jgi:hypothetical protein